MRRSARWTLLATVVGVGVGVVVGGFAFAAPAAAHVSVQADDAIPGSRARVVFRVPNEGETATTKLEVHLLPQGAPPIPSALTAPVAGWSAEIEYASLDEPIEGAHGETIEEAVSVITWTADSEGSGIQPGEYGEFPVIIGPLPEADQLFFPSFQTYAGVDEPVEWIERPSEGEEPSRPAPVLELAAAGSEPSEDEDTSPVASGDTEAAAEADSGDDSFGQVAVGIAIAGLVAALGALGLGFVAFRRTRQ